MNNEKRFRIEIDTRYVGTEDEERFLEVENKTKACYKMAILSFSKALESLRIEPPPYLPKLYVIPFVFHLVSGNKHTFKWNLLTTDPSERQKFAIFPSLPFLEKLPNKFVAASFAHELAHWLSVRVEGVPRLGKEVNMLEADVKLEKGVDDYFKHFGEPVKTWLEEYSSVEKTISFPFTLCHTFRSNNEVDDYLYGRKNR